MSNTISLIDNKKCTGCGACYNKCPVNAIEMKLDAEGFFFPVVNETCVDCGQCYNVCPVVKPVDKNKEPESYAVWADDETRLKSSSGGMFSLLSKVVFDKGGVVFGARYSEDYRSVYHAKAENMEELVPLRGSKYVQSSTELTYRDAEKYLKENRVVLYTGCPCQIAGLYNYLGKDYDNLYTADLVCHGANSVTAYQSFIKEYSNGKDIAKVDFRDKKHYGWSTTISMDFKDGSEKKSSFKDTKWYDGFLEGIINRNNCYSCPYASASRVADITMADCWQISRTNPSYDDRKGTSLVLVNSEKGKKIFKETQKNMKLCEVVSLEEVRKYNGQLNKPTKMHKSRKFFFSHLEKEGYHKALWYGKGMRFDVGLVGWWFASNYGSSLTYYALAKILEKKGKQVLFIPIPTVSGNPWDKDTKQIVDFIGKRFKIGNKRDFSHMKEFNGFCDSFMVGSDQMWVGSTTKLVGYTFYLDFVDKNKKKIAFATSFGKDRFEADEETRATVADYLKRFDAISVREHSGVDVCKNTFGIEAQQVLDPVFLCDQSTYEELLVGMEEKTPKKYLLCYILDPTPEKEAAAREIAKQQNLEIITVLGLKEYDWAVDKWHTGKVMPKVSTEQLLYYIKNCNYLMTDSHHGVCMGIIFKRQYAALVNANRGSTRFEAVAKSLGLESRLVYNPKDVFENTVIYNTIDYDAVQRNLAAEQKRTDEWLENAFKVETKTAEDTFATIRAEYRAREYDLVNRIKWLERRINHLEARAGDKTAVVQVKEENENWFTKYSKKVIPYFKKNGLKATIRRIVFRIKNH